MTDQQHWSLAVPQLGPGKAAFAPRDPGRYLETGERRDRYAFRTPQLRNVAASAPYMHNGAYHDLRSVIRHHSLPVLSLFFYRPARQLEQQELIETVLNDWITRLSLAFSLDRENLPGYLTNREVRDLEAFLNSLTAPDLQARMDATIPKSVPSGLPVERR